MHTKFADKASLVLCIVRICHAFRHTISRGLLTKTARQVPMPDLPVMHVAILLTVVVVPSIRTARPVRRPAIFLFDDSWQDLIVVQRTRHPVTWLIPVKTIVKPLVFIV